MRLFYEKNDITKYDYKNVLYIAYVGKYDNKKIYKYGKSCNIYEREYMKHRKTFEKFKMCYIKISDNKDIIETLFEKELKIRNIHTNLKINKRNQTELFYVNKKYSLKYIINLLNRLAANNETAEIKRLKAKLKLANIKLKYLI